MQEQPSRKADERARRNALLALVAALALGGVLFFAFEGARPGIEAWLVQQMEGPGGVERTVLAVTILAMLPVLALGGYLFVQGFRTVRARRYPPPGLLLVRAAPIIEGAPAARRGRILQLLAVVLLILAVLLPALAWQFARMAMQTA